MTLAQTEAQREIEDLYRPLLAFRDALIASQARRIEELEAFYRAVAHAAGDLDQLPDSHAFEVVWCHSDEDGNPAPGDPFITAGMIRRASLALLNRGEG